MGGRRIPPYGFTEYGAIQAANILKSELAVKMSVYIVRAFIQLREIIFTNSDLAKKVNQLERRVGKHDQIPLGLVHEIQKLIESPKPTRKGKIGFILPKDIDK